MPIDCLIKFVFVHGNLDNREGSEKHLHFDNHKSKKESLLDLLDIDQH